MKEATKEYAMNLLATMAIHGLAERDGRCFEDVFSEFRRSDTYARLYDSDTELWMNGPDYISDEYDLELGHASHMDRP